MTKERNKLLEELCVPPELRLCEAIKEVEKLCQKLEAEGKPLPEEEFTKLCRRLGQLALPYARDLLMLEEGPLQAKAVLDCAGACADILSRAQQQAQRASDTRLMREARGRLAESQLRVAKASEDS
jgi:hypothetical protein